MSILQFASGLRSRGIRCTTTAGAGLLGADDAAHLEFAARSESVLVTSDADFLVLARSGSVHHGIVYFQASTRSIGHIIRYLCLMSDCLQPQEMRGQVEFLP